MIRPHSVRGTLWLALSTLVLLAGCPRPRPSKPPPALVELAPEQFPDFSDDLDYADLAAAIEHSLAYLARLEAGDPTRQVAFGPERVTPARIAETLKKFATLAAARPEAGALRLALQAGFRVFQSTGTDGSGEVLFTGYYLPELRGARAKTDKYSWPLYALPPDLVTVNPKDFPQAGGEIIGRVVNGQLKPYPTRGEIVAGALEGKGAELLWVDSAIDAFFLEIQGSGIVRLPDGTAQVVTYAGKNGQAYTAIGGELVRRGELRRGAVTMQSIRAWLEAHPAERAHVMNTNPSHVFFRASEHALGALEQPVVPGRSVAADRKVFPKGALAFLRTQRPEAARSERWRDFSRFVLDQDSGGAIKGAGRIDIYWGSGEYAEDAAGRLKHPGRLYYLLAR